MADVLIRANVDESGASAGLQRLGTAFEIMERRSLSGAQGLRSVEFGLRSLASQAIGIEGPIGRVAEGLLSFSGGSGLVLGVAAGLGAIAGAYKLATYESERLVTANAKLTKSFEESFGGQRIKQLTGLTDLRRQLEDLEHTADELSGPHIALDAGGIHGTSGGGIAGLGRRLLADVFGPGSGVEEIEANTAIATALTTIRNLEHAITEERKKQTAERAKQLAQEQERQRQLLDERALLEAESAGFIGASLGGANPFGRLPFELRAASRGRPLNLGFRQPIPSGLPGPLEQSLGISIPSFVTSHPAVPAVDAEVDKAQEKLSGKIAGAVAQGIASIATGFRSGGIAGGITGIGGALGALAGAGTKGAVGLSGALAGLGPIGAGIAAGGALISLFQGLFTSAKPAVVMIDGYSSTAISQQQQIMQLLAGVLGVQVSILSAGSASPDQTAYALARAARLDGGMRLPPGAVR